MNPDLKIAQSKIPKKIDVIADSLGISKEDLEHYGHYKAKIPVHLIDEDKVSQSKLILVTAITPTPAGEGKSTTTIGLCDGLNRIGKKQFLSLESPL